MKTLAIVQARMGSTRLPGKVLMPLGNTVVLDGVVSAAEWGVMPFGGAVVVATSTLPQDDAIVDFCKLKGISYHRGSESDVLDRFMGAATVYGGEIILRLTGDCPFLDPKVIAEVVQLREMTNSSYATNTDPPSYPDGLDVEVFTREALEAAHREAIRPSDRDTVTRWIVRNRDRFPAANLVCPLPGLHKERWVLDTQEDYEFAKAVADILVKGKYPGGTGYLDILRILDENPRIRPINDHLVRNERFYEGLLGEAKKLVGTLNADNVEKFVRAANITWPEIRFEYDEEGEVISLKERRR